MGIKHLWSILTPYGERRPLYELQGKTVAVDLSCWICEAQNITEYHIQPKMYLRNLYFRTCYLLLMDVSPVFVLEGKAPELKYQTIADRNEVQFKGAKPKTDKTKTGKDRSRFSFVLKCCEEMLRLMGLVCVKGSGEAEALCASLNEHGLVDGCISQDSDCFAYGAKTVYKNFSISQQGAHAASGGAIDIYNIQKAIDEMDFGRRKAIAMALLCGSDYSDGVYGVGREAALKLFDSVPDARILDHLRSWKTDSKHFDELYRRLNDKHVCKSCGHHGKGHSKSGCRECNTAKGCNLEFKEEYARIKNEVMMRSKALADPTFPNEDLIKEFLSPKDNVLQLDLQWKQPDLAGYVKFTVKHLQWEEIYAFEKFLPLLTRWQLLNPHKTKTQKGPLTAERIKKIRNPKGIPSYEIIWSDPSGHFRNLIPADQLSTVDAEKLWSTIEPQQIVAEALPDLVKAFEDARLKKKAPKRRKNAVRDIESMLANASISEPRRKKPAKQKPIDSYLVKAVVNQARSALRKIQNQDDGSGSNDALRLPDDGNGLDLSRFGDETDLDVSDIVQDIISRTPPKYVKENLERLGYARSEEPLESSFFMARLDEYDLFERSMNLGSSSDVESDSDEKIEQPGVGEERHGFEENKHRTIETNQTEPDDSFYIEEVPLFARLKGKTDL